MCEINGRNNDKNFHSIQFSIQPRHIWLGVRFLCFSFSYESRNKSVPNMKNDKIYFVFDVINHIHFLNNILDIILTFYHSKQTTELHLGLFYIYKLFILYKNTYIFILISLSLQYMYMHIYIYKITYICI